MKKLIPLLYIILINLTPAHSQSTWFWQQPLPTGNFLYAVDFLNENTGYAVGTVGTIMKTTNGGGNWVVQNSNFTSELLGMGFYNTELGFAVGGNNGSILRTSNGGINWTSVFSGATTFLWDIEIPSADRVYAVGLNGIILRSTNGGISWGQQVSSTTANLFSVSFLDAVNGVACGNRVILKTSNGGINWIPQNVPFINPTTQVTSIDYIDPNNIISIATGDDRIYKTTDGGLNWFGLVYFPPDNDIERTISFINKDTGIMVSDYGRILKTTDGAVTWRSDSTFKPDYYQIGVLRFADFVDNNTAYVSGSGGRIIKST
ncbi:MAG: hypothetical protein KDD00_16540, partial [Ignavibacteriae bacterium]|nr:hypothetical protein [Ignavibacteriota bacterium]